MGWNISHHPDVEDLRRSYTSMHNLGQQFAHVLSGRDWRRIKPLFGRAGDPFTVTPADAEQMARILRAAAGHSKMPADWAQDARQLADSAQRAATARQPWTWR